MAQTVSELKIKIQAALEGKSTLTELEKLTRDIETKMKSISQTSSNFRTLASAWERVNAETRKQTTNLDAIINKEKTLAAERKKAEQEAIRISKQQEADAKKFTGQKMVVGSYESLRAQRDQIISQLKTGVGAGGQILNPAQIDQLRAKLAQIIPQLKQMDEGFRSIGRTGKLSFQQILEAGENLTVIMFGLRQFIADLINIGKQIYDIARQGAEFGVMKQNFEQMAGGAELAAEKLAMLKQASSGNLNDQELIDYAAGMQLMGFAVDDTIQILDLIERQSDKVSLTFEKGQNALQRYILTGRRNALIPLKLSIQEIEKEMVRLTGSTMDNIKKLDDADQQYLRTQAIINVYGESIDSVKNKQKDNADTLVSVQKELENAKLKVGLFISEGLVKMINQFGLSTKASTTFVGGLSTIGGSIPTLLISLASLRTAITGIGLASLATAGLVVGAFALIGGALIYGLYMKDQVDTTKNQFEEYKKMDKEIKDIKAENERTAKLKDTKVDLSKGVTVVIPEKDKQDLKDYTSQIKEYQSVTTEMFIEKKQELATLKSEQKSKEDLARIQNELNKLGTKKGGAPDKQKEVDATEELIRAQRFQIEYAKAFGILSAEILDKAIDTLAVERNATDNKQDQLKLQQAINGFYQERAELITKELADVRRINETLAEREANLLQKKIESDTRRIESEKESERVLADLREQTAETEFEKTMMRIDREYQERIDNIFKTVEVEKQRDAMLMAMNIKLQAEQTAWASENDRIMNEFFDGVSKGFGLANNLMKALKIGNEEWTKKFIQGLQQGLEILKQINLISQKSEEGGMGFGDIVGLLGSIVGLFALFDEGGFTGNAGQRQPVGVVHGQEYVVPARMGFLFPLLEAIRTRTGGFNTAIGQYYTGGLVQPASTQNINFGNLEARIKGTDIMLAWRRQKKIETRRGADINS